MASTQLTRSIGSTGNRQKSTFSMWIKKSKTATEQVFYSHYQDASNFLRARFNNTDTINVNVKLSGTDYFANTNAVFRDVGAFYHIVWAIDTTQATAADRYKVYVNGTQQTMASSNYPSQNENLIMNISGDTQAVGAMNSSTYFDGLMSYVAWTDGYTYAATDFGETDSSSGIWKIKTGPSVTYGTNGFFLKMDTSSPGTDTSGNNNTFTAAGTPTLTQDNASNVFATFNAIYKNFNQPAFTNGNLTATSSSSGYHNTFSTIAVSTGKWYAEFKRGSSEYQIGISSLFDAQTLFPGTDYYLGETSKSLGISSGDGKYRINTTATTYGASYADGDIIGLALDLDNKKLYASKNGAWANGSGAWDSATFNSATGAIDISAVIPSGEYAYLGLSIGDPGAANANFGNGFFGTTAVSSSNADAAGYGLMEYAIPTGYYTLNTKNLNTYG